MLPHVVRSRRLAPDVSTTIFAGDGMYSKPPLAVLRTATPDDGGPSLPSELKIFAEDPKWASQVGHRAATNRCFTSRACAVYRAASKHDQTPGCAWRVLFEPKRGWCSRPRSVVLSVESSSPKPPACPSSLVVLNRLRLSCYRRLGENIKFVPNRAYDLSAVRVANVASPHRARIGQLPSIERLRKVRVASIAAVVCPSHCPGAGGGVRSRDRSGRAGC